MQVVIEMRLHDITMKNELTFNDHRTLNKVEQKQHNVMFSSITSYYCAATGIALLLTGLLMAHALLRISDSSKCMIYSFIQRPLPVVVFLNQECSGDILTRHSYH